MELGGGRDGKAWAYLETVHKWSWTSEFGVYAQTTIIDGGDEDRVEGDGSDLCVYVLATRPITYNIASPYPSNDTEIVIPPQLRLRYSPRRKSEEYEHRRQRYETDEGASE